MSEHEILKLNHPVILADGKKLDHLEVRRPPWVTSSTFLRTGVMSFFVLPGWLRACAA